MINMKNNIFFHKNPVSNETKKGSLNKKKAVIQSNISVRDWPTEAGSTALEGFIAIETATTVERFNQAGGIITGSSHISEFAFGIAQDTTPDILINRHADCALVTDTLGESRHIACETGMCALKPTYGIVSRFGLIGIIPSMETIGIVAKTPREIADILKEISGPDDKDVSMSGEKIHGFSNFNPESHGISTIGIPIECANIQSPREKQDFDAAVETLKNSGIKVREIQFPSYPVFETVHSIIGSVETSSACGKYDSVRYGHRAKTGDNWNDMYINSRKESFGTVMKTYLFQGTYFQFENYKAFEHAAKVRAYLYKQAADLFKEVDIIVSPVETKQHAPVKAATISEIYKSSVFTLPANILGYPSVTLPASNNNQDCGLHLLGKPNSDVSLLSFAATLCKQETT